MRTKSRVPAPVSCSRRKSRPDRTRPTPGAPMFEQTNGIKTHYVVDGPADAPWVTFVTGIANDTTHRRGRVSAPAVGQLPRAALRSLRGQGKSRATPRRLFGRAFVRRPAGALGCAGNSQIPPGRPGPGWLHQHRHGNLRSRAPAQRRTLLLPRQNGTGIRRHVAQALRNTVRAQGVEAIVEPTAQRLVLRRNSRRRIRRCSTECAK